MRTERRCSVTKKTQTSKPDEQSLILVTHMVEGKRDSNLFSDLHTHHGVHACVLIHRYTHNKHMNIHTIKK